jgi:chemotaxis protein MotB
MKKRHKHPEHSNMERWLISYADFITLLFILFLVLFAMSQVDVRKFESLIESFANRGAGISVLEENPGSLVPKKSNQMMGPENQSDEKMSTKEKEQKNINEDNRLRKLKQEIEDYASANGLQDAISAQIEENGLNLLITSGILFKSGEADLLPSAIGIIDGIFQKLLEYDNEIRVEGHTDNTPIHTAKFPSNWELSTARSVNVIRHMIEERGFDPSRLSAVGYGEYHPIDTNETAEGRTKNRRVEIIVLRKQ